MSEPDPLLIILARAMLGGIWVGTAWHWTRGRSWRPAVGAVGLVSVSTPPLWRLSVEARAGDSFFTLPPLAAAGLALLSIALVVGLLTLSGGKTALLQRWSRTRRWPHAVTGTVDAVASVLLFWLLWWSSPQIYYAYYRLVIPGLPNQWVVRHPPDPDVLLALARFEPGTLSGDASGMALWAVAVSAVWCAGLFLVDDRRKAAFIAAGAVLAAHVAG